MPVLDENKQKDNEVGNKHKISDALSTTQSVSSLCFSHQEKENRKSCNNEMPHKPRDKLRIYFNNFYYKNKPHL